MDVSMETLTVDFYPEDAAVLLALLRRVETIDDMASLGVTLWQLRRIADTLGEPLVPRPFNPRWFMDDGGWHLTW